MDAAAAPSADACAASYSNADSKSEISAIKENIIHQNEHEILWHRIYFFRIQYKNCQFQQLIQS
jgi:hypothetical protein